MKIKLPKPIMRDPNALDAKSRKSAGSFRDRRNKRLQQKIDEIFEESFSALADVEVDWEDDIEPEEM